MRRGRKDKEAFLSVREWDWNVHSTISRSGFEVLVWVGGGGREMVEAVPRNFTLSILMLRSRTRETVLFEISAK